MVETKQKWWMEKPWRMIQTNLREIDMRDIDAERVAADLRGFGANVLMINTSGIISSYPTKLPYHYQSPYLQGDSLKEVADACRSAGIRVIGRMDFSKVRRPVYERHPEWAFVSVKGETIDYNGDVHVCFNSEYQQHLSLEIMAETIETLGIDGVFFNMEGYHTNFDYSGNYYGICQCVNCRKRFEEMYGEPLPTEEIENDPRYVRYREFQAVTVRLHRERVYRYLTGRWPDLCVANHPEVNAGFYRAEANTSLGSWHRGWHYDASHLNKLVRHSWPGMATSITTVDFIDIAYRHVAVSPHQQKLRLLQNLAYGGALDYYLIGRLDNHADRSGFEAVRSVFRHHQQHEAEYADLHSTARTLLLQSQTASFGRTNQAEFRGWFRFLTEHCFAFDTLAYERASTLVASRYDCIILPDYEASDDELAGRLDEFVARGGTLVAVHRSGMRDGSRRPREENALRCLGIRRVRETRTDMKPAYFWRDESERPAGRDDAEHGSGDTSLIYLHGSYIFADYEPAAIKRMRLVPPHPFGPPERCYYTDVTDEPGYTVHPYGAGRGVYIPWGPGEMFHHAGHTNTSDFIGCLLREELGLRPYGGNLPPMVEATVMRKGDGSSLLVQLVNGSGHFGNSYYRPVAMTDLRIVIPCAERPTETIRLSDGGRCPFEWENGHAAIALERLAEYEAIKLVLPVKGAPR